LKPPSVFLIPLASPIHEDRAAKRVVKARELLAAGGVKVFGPLKPVCSPSEFPSFNPEEYDAIAVFVASGGTSSLAATLVQGKPWTLWAYHENNSLPSALSAREKLEAKGLWRGKLYYGELSQPPGVILAEAWASALLKSFQTSTFLLVAEEERLKSFSSRVEEVSRIFGFKALFYPSERLVEAARRFPPEEVARVFKERLGRAELTGVTFKEVDNPLRLYLALASLVREMNAEAVTVDCFRFIVKNGFTPCLALALLSGDGIPSLCEADLASLPLLLALTRLSNKPAWLANLARVDQARGVITLAHCTAPLELAKQGELVKLKSHFETDAGVSLDVPLAEGAVTLAHLTLKPLKLFAASGKIVRSQLEDWGLCRTQVEVKLNGEVLRLLKATGNHHVVAYGNHVEALIRLGERVGAEVIMFKGGKNL